MNPCQKKSVSSSKKYNQKLVVFLSRFPYPLEKGDKLRAFHQLKSLSQKFDIYLICTTEVKISKENYNQLVSFCKEIHIFKLNKIFIFFNLFKALFTNIPFQVAYFTQRKIKIKVNTILDELNPDLIYCQLIRPAEYVKNYHFCFKTIDLMDALSVGMERRIKKANFFLRFIFKEEAIRLKKYERQILNYFEKSIIISEQDKNYILHPKDKNIHVVPNGIDESFSKCEIDISKKFDIVFTGNMSYHPNIEASNYIIEKIFPEMLKSFPDFKVLLSGSNPSSKIKNKFPDSIHISGWVDDIRMSYLKSKIFVAPLFSGSGMQNKILEAMALGIPCITTSLVNNAILAKNKIEILIADDINAICKAIHELMKDEHLYNEISKNGKNYIVSKYSWDKVNADLIQVLEN